MTGGSEVTAPPPPEEGSGSGSGSSSCVDHLKSLPASDPSVPLHNLSRLHRNLSSLRHFLSHSLTHRHPLPDHHLHSISLHLSTAIHHTILNAAALLSPSPSSHPHPPSPLLPPDPPADPKEEPEIVEIDAMELLADHVHFCEICGKGFKRDANLRMHMRAHGNKFKTLESLTSSTTTAAAFSSSSLSKAAVRFSCPFAGCNRNKNHGRFRPMKSAVCVKNHYRRSHCPKTYSCTSCNKKSFSVLADLRSHQRSCGKCSRWRCSCGTCFSRKDKLFGHVALFEGHLPVMVDEGKGVGLEDGEEEEEEGIGAGNGGGGDDELFDVLMDGFESVDRGFLDSVMGCPDDFCDL